MVVKIKKFVEHLRALPETEKKIIFFAVLIAAALVIGSLQIGWTKRHFQAIGESLGETDFSGFNSAFKEVGESGAEASNIIGDIMATVSASDAEILFEEEIAEESIKEDY